MAWINEFMEKVGLGEVAKIAANSPDSPPEGFELEKAAQDYLETRAAILKSSEDYKKQLKEAGIVQLKNYKKKINDTLSLGLSGEEAATLDPDEFLGKVKEKYSTDLDSAKNARTAEWQDKYKAIETEFNSFKGKFEQTEQAWKKKLEEVETRTQREQAELKRQSLFGDVFGKLDFGSDPAHKENAKIIVQSVMKEKGWNFKEDGTLFRGENDPVINADGHSILKSLEDGIKQIAAERKLFPQANTGGGNGQAGSGKPYTTGNDETDKIIQQQMNQLAALDSKFKNS